MTTKPTEMKRLTDQQLVDMLALAKDADSVELKLTVPESDQRSTRSWRSTWTRSTPRSAMVYFFDTPDLALQRAGVVVRARRIQGRGDDSVVKLRPVVPTSCRPRCGSSPNFGVEVDAMPGGFVCSASMKSDAWQRPT